MKKNFYYEPSSKTNIYILGVAVSMWKQHDFETIFTYNGI